MRILISFLFVICFTFSVFGQTENKPNSINFGIEEIDEKDGTPKNWFKRGTSNYVLKADNTTKKSGNYSLLIESKGATEPGSFAFAGYTIPVDFSGQEIELRGFLKLKDVADGAVGMLFRIDGNGSILQFENMLERKLSGTMDWTEYSIKFTLSEESDTILFGVLTQGKGQVWADDFKILVDGKDISQAPKKALPKAKLDKEFDEGSKINSIKLNSKKISDLAVLGKVWGFLKYHHPAITKGNYNWDYELFRILPKILSAKNKNERNEILNKWIVSLGSFELGKNEVPESNVTKLQPDFTWINEKSLGIKLTQNLQNIRNAQRTGSSYYIGMASGVGNPIFKNEDSHRKMTYPDAGFRLLALYRYWNMIQYFFPYRHLIGEDWNKILSEFVPKFVSATNELEYKKTALILINRIHDTHANIGGNDDTINKFSGLNFAPFRVEFVENKAVVVQYWNEDLAEKSGVKIGDVIESINGKSVSQIVKENLEYHPASNYPTKLRDIARNLLRTNENSLIVEFNRGKETKEVIVECYLGTKAKVNIGELYQKPIPAFKLISPEISYLYPGSLKKGEIEKLKPEIAKTKGLIVDLRSYPSDFIVFSLGELLLPKPTGFVKFTKGSVSNPGLFTFTEELKVGRENPDYYRGKVVILINETTQSQAEYTTMALRTAPLATVIGSTTAGADGNISGIFLPGGVSTYISGIGVYYPDGKETQRIGIIPDVEFKPTIKGVAEGRDEMLEKAIEIIKQNDK